MFNVMPKKLSALHRQRISDSLRDRPKSPQHREAISRAMHGRVFSDEHKAKLRASRVERELKARLYDVSP
jgi:hypothetical protein